ncbi:Hsp70 family protein [Actinoplanes sp. NBC_00393]|uniref:Hsp70 family protein n=1 Tax=Actinoplanes sp. NBC_00393 TaxID=2975953 RepID=UPI002E1B05D3
MSKPIGIDLGTTMSAMAVVDDHGRPSMIHNNKGHTLTPSAVMIRGAERIVGELARNSAVARPQQVVQFIKREMSRPDFVYSGEDGQKYTPEELSALILRKLKQDAAAELGEEVRQAVITVPAYFADLERHRTRTAGEIAGLEVIDIINEPTAAAIAYGLGGAAADGTILVYDLGGGTFDITIMRLTGGNLEVKTSNGNHALGGADFDEALAGYFAEQFEAEHGIRPLEDPRFHQDFWDRAEKAKIDLSDADETFVNLTAGGKFLDLELQRSTFEQLIGHYIDQTQQLTETALADAGMSAADVDKVLLVGGSTRIPAVQRMVRELLGREPETGINPDEVVALGAAIYAANERGVTVRDTSGKVRPPAKFRNVTAHSLGIVVREDDGTSRNSKVIPKDSPIPARGGDVFSTFEDNQTSVHIEILQGEDDDPEECIKVGDAGVLSGIAPQPRGVPKIAVSLEYDKSGMVHVRARDEGTGRELRATIEYSALMSEGAKNDAIRRVEQAKVR